MARIWPVRLSMASSAPSTSGVCSSATETVPPRFVDGGDLDLHDVADLHQVGRRRAARPLESVLREDAVELADPHARRARRQAPAGLRGGRHPPFGGGGGHLHHDGGHDVSRANRAVPPALAVFARRRAPRDAARRLPVAAPLVEVPEPAIQRPGRGRLEVVVERGLDREPELVEGLRAVLPLEVLAHLLGEVRRGRVRRAWQAGEHDRLLARRLGLRLRDEPFLRHAAQGVVAALRGPLLVDVGALPLGQLQDARNRRGFPERQVLHRLAEVHPRRGLDAVGAVAEVHLVAVEREDLRLGVALLDLEGEHDLLDLPLERLLRLEEQLARELLRERAGAGIEQPALVRRGCGRWSPGGASAGCRCGDRTRRPPPPGWPGA